MKNMNQFENEQEFDREDLSATELTAGPDNLLDDDLEGEDTGSIDTDYATENLDTEDDDIFSDEDDAQSAEDDNIDSDTDFTGRDDS
ncbi:MAG: hypothetical protein EOP47_10210 [Sphingobacteriaceae bacterium]|nr:MAG: hypothetical protein EOP47_10210 [Sphingobacteriaceae bacterium]